MFKRRFAKKRLLLVGAMAALFILVVACTAPAVPTVAPTQAPPPTQAPQATKAPEATKAPTVAATVAPTVAPTKAPTVSGVSDADLAKEADFFKGKSVDFVVPYSTGGGYDSWARILAPIMKKYAGATFVVKNAPGAGGLTGTNQIYAAEANGLTIGIINGPGVTQSQLTDAAGVKFDLAKFTYIGRLTADQRVLAVGSKGKFKSLDDMLKSTDKVKIGAPGPGSSNFAEAVMLGTALGMKMDIVLGYDTSEEVDLAVIRGDLDASYGSYSSKVAMIQSGDLVPVLQYGKDPIADLPKVPIVTKLPNLSDDAKQLITIALALGEVGRPIVAPPGVPAARARFLEIALKKSLEDPELHDIAKKQKLEILYLSAADTTDQAKNGVGISDAQKKRLQDLLRQYTPGK